MKTHTRIAAITIWATLSSQSSSQVLCESYKLLANDAATGDEFGHSVAIDNGIIALGARWDDDNGDFSGSAYLFDSITGSQIAKLLPNDGDTEHEFGYAIAIDNGIVAVGSRFDDANGVASGSAYLFDATTGNQLLKLVPTDGAAGDFFGWSIAVDNGVVAVGSSSDEGGQGSAYLFDAKTGSQLFKLLPNDSATQGRFGWSIAINNGIVAVGGVGYNDNGSESGAAYLFDASTGKQLNKLLPTDGQAGDWFGYSVAIDNNTIAIGAYQDDDNALDSGSAYLFDQTTGTQSFKLLPSDGGQSDHFGYSIAIENNIVAVGALFDSDSGFQSGAAFLFDATDGTQTVKLLPTDGSPSDEFGRAIDINNDSVVIGAYRNDDNGSNSGSAYMFTVPTDCPADISGEGDLNFIDVSAFLVAFGNENHVADFLCDGNYNFLDVSAFLDAFGAGCP